MIRSLFSMLLSLGLMGCATSPAQYAKRANSLSSPALCYIEYAGDNNDRIYSRAELNARSFTCQPHDIQAGRQEVGQMQDRKAASDAVTRQLQMEMGLRLLQPPQAPPPRPVMCYTNPYGYTVCN
jgi:hypothetical protein